MDITSFVTGNRDRALLIGDYNTYRAQLSRQLLALRKRLGRTTPKNSKYAAKASVTAEDIAGNNGFVRLLLIQAERAWAQAMHMKSTHVEDSTSHGIVGPTRRHIISRLHKAYGHAETLTALLSDRAKTGATDVDYLEAQAYTQCLAGAEDFEKQSSGGNDDPKAAWRECLVHFSEAHIIYTALLSSTQKDMYKEVLAGTVDPSIRYAAYQSRLSRTIPVTTVAKQHFPNEKAEIKSLVEKVHPSVFEDEKASTESSKSGTSSNITVPTTITWRGRTAPIADAAIGQAVAATSSASSQLSSFFSSTSSNSPKAFAAAYDPVLTSAQDTVDAVRRALSDLLKEGIPESDPRTQDLRVSDLAANHSLISWRIGRNRILISTPGTRDDGAAFAPEVTSRRAPKKKCRTTSTTTATDGEITKSMPKAPKQSHESKSHSLARLAERIALYDATLQSIDSIKDLRGASRDAKFISELDGQHAYFRALRALNVGYSHSILGAHTEALALFSRANEVISAATSTTAANSTTDPPTVTVTDAQITALRAQLKLQLVRQHGLVSLHLFAAEDAAKAAESAAFAEPLIHRLGEYPVYVDLNNIVQYPPKLEPVPVKPIFLDLAWNYIKYPGEDEEYGEEGGQGEDGDEVGTGAGIVEQAREAVGGVAEQVGNVVNGVMETEAETETETQSQPQQGRRRGWFGFGRG